AFRGHGDEGGPVLLVAALHEPVVADLARRPAWQVDHVIGRLALGIVKAGAGDLDPRGPAFHIVAASPFLEAAAGHAQLPIVADIDRMGAAARPFAGSQAGEGGTVDHDPAIGVGTGENALLTV